MSDDKLGATAKVPTAKLPTYNIETKEGRRRIRARIRVLDDRKSADIVLTPAEKRQLKQLTDLLNSHYDRIRREQLLKAGADAAELKARLEEEKAKQETQTPTPTPESTTASEEGSREHSRDTTPGNTPPSTGATPPSRGSPPSPGGTPPGGPPAGSPSDSDDDDMPGRPSGQEINSIPLFTGTNIDPEIWLQQVNTSAATFGWEDNAKAGAACLRFTEKAAVWLESQRTLNKLPFATWDAFTNAFLGRFKPLGEAIQATEAVLDLKQKEGELIAEYADRIVIAIDKKNFTYTANQKTADGYIRARDADAYSFMAAGMSDRLRRQVMSGSDPPTTFDDLKKKATAAETAFRAKHLIQEIEQSNGKHEQLDDDNESKSGISTTTDTDSIAEIKQSIEEIKKGFKCFNCGKFGHLRRSCPDAAKNSNSGGWRGGGRGGQSGSRGQGGWRGRGRGNWRGGPGRGRGTYGYGYQGNQNGYYRGNRGGGFTPQANFGQPNYYQNNFPQQYPPQFNQNQYNQGPRFQQPYGYPPSNNVSSVNNDSWEVIDAENY